jgi:hypothetical protein
MARYTKITKISENNNTHVYEICNDSAMADCYAVLDGTNKVITIYKDTSLKELLFEYDTSNDADLHKPFGIHAHLFAGALQKLIPAIKKNTFPAYLDKCS